MQETAGTPTPPKYNAPGGGAPRGGGGGGGGGGGYYDEVRKGGRRVCVWGGGLCPLFRAGE